MHRLTVTIFAAGLALAGGEAAAQNTTAPPPVVPTQAAPAPALLPGAGNFSLPGTVTVPEAAKPAVTPPPIQPMVAKPAALKPAEPTKSKPVEAKPVPATAIPAPVVTAPVTVATPPPIVTAPPPAAAAPVVQPATLWLPYALGSLVVLAGLALVLRRRSATDEEQPIAAPIIPEPAPHPVRASGPATPWLKLEIRPIRAGPTPNGAAAEFELVLRNAGQATAERITVEAALFSASEWQEELVSAFQDADPAKPLIAAFDLPGGEERTLIAAATMAPDGVEAVDFRGRPMFVPILSVKAGYVFAGGKTGFVSETRILGVEKPGEARIGPFWLDRPRMESAIGTRPFVPRPLASA